MMEQFVVGLVHPRPVAGYCHFAPNRSAFDVVKTPTVVPPVVDFKVNRSWRSIPDRQAHVSEQNAAAWHISLDTAWTVVFQRLIRAKGQGIKVRLPSITEIYSGIERH
jgi:hypothetical protein